MDCLIHDKRNIQGNGPLMSKSHAHTNPATDLWEHPSGAKKTFDDPINSLNEI